MSEALLSKIEESIRRLSASEQLRLMERLARYIRENSCGEWVGREDQLAIMASDPDIQRELQMINEEFFCAENDGLGNN